MVDLVKVMIFYMKKKKKIVNSILGKYEHKKTEGTEEGKQPSSFKSMNQTFMNDFTQSQNEKMF